MEIISGIIHEVFDWIGIPILVTVFLFLFFLESKFQLRKSVQKKWDRMQINNLVSIPSFVLLRFLFLPVMVWLAVKNETLHYGLIHLFELPIWIEAAIAFMVLDFTNYLWHILNHKIPWLWRFHLVHHTDLDLDITTATRFHFGEMIGSVFFRGAFVILSGASPLLVLVYEIIFEAATQFHHTNVRLPLGFEKMLSKIFVTPRMHGIHHSIIKNETDSNYAVIFSFWDRIGNTLRLNVSQNELVIGVPGYEKEDITGKKLYLLPFAKLKPWSANLLTRNESKSDDNKMKE